MDFCALWGDATGLEPATPPCKGTLRPSEEEVAVAIRLLFYVSRPEIG